MNYKLTTNENGMVSIIRKAGSAYVKTFYPEGMCRGLIANAETVKSSNRWEGMGIVINGDEIYFEGEITSEEEPATEDKKPEKKDFHNNFQGKKRH